MKIIHSYHHHDGSVGVLVEFHCGTDFTARTKEFKEFMDNVCMTFAFNPVSLEGEELEIEMVHSSQTLKEYLAAINDLFQEKISIERSYKMVYLDKERNCK